MASRGSVFHKVGGLKPRRSLFDLSYRTNFTCDMGQLVPVMCDEVVPGDHFTIGSEVVIRFQPMQAPIMHEISATVHYFFVPYRILWEHWEDFISQGQLGGDVSLPISLPRADEFVQNYHMRSLGSLWDYFGFPVSSYDNPQNTANIKSPMDFPWRAYNMVFNEYYRDQDLQAEVDLLNYRVLNRNWRKDYFTASRPFQQKGTAPALPVNVDLGIVDDMYNIGVRLRNANNTLSSTLRTWADSPKSGEFEVQSVGVNNFGFIGGNRLTAFVYDSPTSAPNLVEPSGRDLVVSPSDISAGLRATSTTFDVSDLRLAFQTQKWLERNARAGTRYTEFLRSHFGVAPSDSRLDRPEYIGGIKTPIRISEVLQTSQTTTGETGSPQGQFAGHGVAGSGDFVGKYFVPEYGCIIGIMSVMPKPAYQQGVNRQWLRELPTDFYFPEFCRLSEQAIEQAEIFYGFGVYDDRQPFGFTGQYDEMRVKHDIVASEMRITQHAIPSSPGFENRMNLSYWNLARHFDRPPLLNSEFITCSPMSTKDIFTVTNVPGLIVNVYNKIKAARPMPAIADPGLVDHY